MRSNTYRMEYRRPDGDAASTPLLKTIGEGSIIFAVGNIILKVVAVLSTILVLRYISVYDYGIWKLASSILGVAAFFTLVGAENVLLADLSRELGRRREDIYRALFGQSLRVLFFLGCAVSVGLFFAAPLISAAAGLELTMPLRVLAFFFILSGINRAYFLAFYSHLKYVHVQGMKIIARAAYVALLAIFIFYFDAGLMSIVYAYVLSYVVQLAVFAPSFLNTVAYLKAYEPDARVALLDIFKRHGKWALFTNYVEDLVGAARPWIIGYFLGVEAVAIISIAMTILGEVINAVPLSQALSPVMPREVDEKERFKFLFGRGLKYSVWFYVLLAFAAYFAAPPAVALLFPNYNASVPLFQMLLVALPAVPFSIFATQAFYALKSQRELFIATTSARSVMIPIVLPALVKFFGAAGAIAEYIATSYMLAVSRVVALRRKFPELYPPLLSLIRFDATDAFLLKRIAAHIVRRNVPAARGVAENT